MAYLAVVTVRRSLRGGKRKFDMHVHETGASAGDEWNSSAAVDAVTGGSIVDWFHSGTFTFQADCSVNIQPEFGKASGWSNDSANDIDGTDQLNTHVVEGVPNPFHFDPAASVVWYGRSKVASGNTNTIDTYLTLVED